MLQRILLENIGRFRRLTWPEQALPHGVSVIYGENAAGKTTLSSVLRAASSGDVSAVVARRTLDAADAPVVTLHTSTGSVEFADLAWQARYPRLLVFNRDFVHANVYVGQEIGADQREGLYEIAIGAAAVTAKQKVEETKKRVAEAADLHKKSDAALRARLVSMGGSVDELRAASPLPRPPDDLLERRARLAQRQTSGGLSQARSFESLPAFEAIDLTRLRRLLDTSCTGLSEQAVRAVRAHVAERLDDKGEAWLAQGAGYARHPDGACPYCAQPLSSSSIAESFPRFFDASYNGLKERLAAGVARIDALDRWARKVIEVLRANETALAEWRRFAEMSAPPEASPMLGIQDTVLCPLRALLEEKLATPLVPCGGDPRIEALSAALGEVHASFGAYAAWVDVQHRHVERLRAAEARETEALAADLRRVELGLLRGREEVATLLAGLDEAIAAEAVAKASLRDAEAALADAGRAQAEVFVERVNKNLGAFGAPFRMVDLACKSSTTRVTAEFALALTSGGRVRASRKQPGEPRFDTVLSEGDRATLGFAVFCAMVVGQPDLDACTIVLDDPAVSLDAHRRAKMCAFTRRLGERAAQVLVLSHDERLLREIVKACGVIFQRCLRDGNLEEWDAEHA